MLTRKQFAEMPRPAKVRAIDDAILVIASLPPLERAYALQRIAHWGLPPLASLDSKTVVEARQ